MKLPDLSPETKKDLNQLFHTRLASLHHQQSPVYKNDRRLNQSNKYQKDNYSKTKKVDYKPLNHNRAYH